MSTYAQSLYVDSQFGVPFELPHAGMALENPYVFDATAQELKHMARLGLVEIVDEHATRADEDLLIDRLTFVRRR